MPVVKRIVDLGQAVAETVIPPGNVALSLVVTECTVGVPYEVRCGTGGDWLGPFVGVGQWPLTIELGDGLPETDRSMGVYVRAVTPTPGAFLILVASFGHGGPGGGVGAQQ